MENFSACSDSFSECSLSGHQPIPDAVPKGIETYYYENQTYDQLGNSEKACPLIADCFVEDERDNGTGNARESRRDQCPQQKYKLPAFPIIADQRHHGRQDNADRDDRERCREHDKSGCFPFPGFVFLRFHVLLPRGFPHTAPL
ncbi:MAG: hypothetical protein J5544_05235 [Clostridia bacterium]|nr:hypothetical protein [Clostridia bacterium]